jgi:hypothetical protein
MKRILSTALVVTLLLSLGGLAVLARGGGSILTPAGSVVAAAPQPQTAAAPDAPAILLRYNAIALPLDVSGSNLNKASDLVAYINTQPGSTGPSVEQVLKWNDEFQLWDYWLPNFLGGFGTDFDLTIGGAYLVQLGSGASTALSFVGNVPDQGSLRNVMLGGSPCKSSFVTIPLDQYGSGVTKAAQLVTAIKNAGGDVEQVLSWNATYQLWDYWLPNFLGGFGTDFDVLPGYPYMLCLNIGTTWP